MLKISKSLIVTFLVLFLYAAPAFAATSIPFTITMSKAVNITGTPRIAIDVGGVARYATYTSGSGTSALTFTHTMVTGDVDLDGITLTSTIDLNGGTIKDLAGNDLSPLTFTAPNTTNVKVNYPSLGMDFIYDADGRYTLNGTAYNDLNSFLSAAGGTFSRASVGTYFDSAGILQTAASGVPRFDYAPVTHAAKGMLIEESRTNVLQKSSDIGSSPWGYSNANITYNTVTAPDGSVSAEKLYSTAVTGNHETFQSLSITSGVTYTTSVYLKKAEISYVRFGFSTSNFGTNSNAVFNLNSGTFVAGAGITSADMVSVGNGWYRCIITDTATTTSTAVVEYITLVANDGSTSSYAGDGASGVYLWGAQLEQGAFATSYIPTTTAAVTRPADYLTIPTGAWYNQSAGTFYDDTEWVSIAGANYPMLFRVDDTTNNNRWNAFYKQSTSTIGVDAFNSGISQGSWFSMPTSTSGTKKLAAAQSLNNANAAFDGIIQTLDTTWTPPTITRLVLSGGSSTASIWQKSLKYYPLRVSDAQLQLLTQ